MFGRRIALFLLTAFLGVGAAAALVPAADTSGDAYEAQTPQASAPADTSQATAPADTAEPAVVVPDTTAPEAPPPAPVPSPSGATVIYGKTTLEIGAPLPAVTAKLFIDGLEEASAVTDTSGSYSITARMDRSADQTVVMWFTPPRGIGLAREIVVLKESREAREARVYNPCIQRVPLRDSTLVDVQVVDQQAYAQRIEESGCMEMVVEELVTYEPMYRLAPEDTFRLTNNKSTSFVQQFGGTRMESGSSSSFVYSVTVDSVSSEGAILGFEFVDGSVAPQGPNAGGGVDLSPLMGRQVSMLLSPLGETSTFRGFEALPEIEVAQGNTLGEADYKNSLRYLFPTLPAQPVAQGESWTDEFMMREDWFEGSSTTTANVTYTLVGETVLEGVDCLEIDAESDVTFKGEGTMRGSPLTADLSGSGNAKIYFSVERGMILRMTEESRLEGSSNAMGMEIPVFVENESEVKVAFR